MAKCLSVSTVRGCILGVLAQGGSVAIIAPDVFELGLPAELLGDRRHVHVLTGRRGERSAEVKIARFFCGTSVAPRTMPHLVVLRSCSCGAPWEAVNYNLWRGRPYLRWRCRYGRLIDVAADVLNA